MLAIVPYVILFAAIIAFYHWGLKICATRVDNDPLQLIIGLVFIGISLVLCWRYYVILWQLNNWAVDWVMGGSLLFHIIMYPGMALDNMNEVEKVDKA